MAREILGEYGRDSHQPQKPRAGCGGVEGFRDTMNHSPPQTPGYNHHAQNGPGLGDRTVHHCGTQGAHGTRTTETGMAGIGGANKGHGTNRRG